MSLRDHAHLLESVRTQSLTDELTGLGNRRSLFLTLQRELGREDAASMVFAIYDLNGFKRYNDTFGHPSGDALLVRLADRLAQAAGPFGHAFRLGGDEFCLLVPCEREAMQDVVASGLAALTDEGEGFRVGAELGSVVLPDEASDATNALRLADERLYAQKYSLYQGGGEAHEVLLRVLDERDPALREQMRVVTELATAIGGQLGLAGQSLDQLRLAAELHDIGKLAVPVSLLEKVGPLEEGEWELVRQHPVVGQRMLSGVASMREVGQIVRATHERWDGGGYVDGLAGTSIPLAARIIAVCDAYVAMTTDRPFRRALPALQAVAELRRCSGAQFDPQVVFAFCRLHDDIVRPQSSEMTAVG